MIAGLEAHIGGRALRVGPSRLEGDDFSVRATKLHVGPLPDDATISDEHTPHEWIGMRMTPTPPSEESSPLEMGDINGGKT